MRGESMKDKSKKSTYSTTFGVDPFCIGIRMHRCCPIFFKSPAPTEAISNQKLILRDFENTRNKIDKNDSQQLQKLHF